ncbi:YbjN domain-containing protein [Laspinema sp. D1]|uniref:hypothetical protein n=1 Tax=Laspinema palackyanum TaxID=3231601 RepID=UPI00347C3670|nr:YbjN domain-containing protein [Laspinema sp. D2b]
MNNQTRNHRFLQYLQQIFEDKGLLTNIEKPNQEADFYTLIVRFSALGEEKNYIADLQFSFLPSVLSPYSNTPAYLIQCFSEIPVMIQPKAERELLCLLNKINLKLPVGYFGINPNQITYFKTGVFLDQDFLNNSTLYGTLIERQCDPIIFSIDNFIDAIAQVSSGRVQTKEVLKNHGFASLFGF